jgi:hypothetical protein
LDVDVQVGFIEYHAINCLGASTANPALEHVGEHLRWISF